MSGKHIKQVLFLILIFDVVLSSCSNETQEPTENKTGVIWDASDHCAFTDLIEYRGALYCCFREANNHASDDPNDNGIIRVLCSKDGDFWESIGTLVDNEYDLRDPKLLKCPDGRLMVHFGRRNTHRTNYNWNCVKFVSDRELTEKHLDSSSIYEINIDEDVELSNYWIWKPKWINNELWGIAYMKDTLPVLVKSLDGIHYTSVTRLNVNGNEADIDISNDGNLTIVIRGMEGNGFIGLSSNAILPVEWNWSHSNIWIQSPCIYSLNGYQIVAGRSLNGTSIFLIRNGQLYPILNFECSGDYAYPGLAVLGNFLYISYYATLGNSEKIIIRKVAITEIMDLISQVSQ